jgi:hypothetical protein
MNTTLKKEVSSERSRCTWCNKKTMLPVICKCLNSFCISCRYPELHKCTFDYQKESQTKLTKENPKTIAQKVGVI